MKVKTENPTEYRKKYYSENKEKFKTKNQYCDVCLLDLKGHIERHYTSKKHLHMIEVREKMKQN